MAAELPALRRAHLPTRSTIGPRHGPHAGARHALQPAETLELAADAVRRRTRACRVLGHGRYRRRPQPRHGIEHGHHLGGRRIELRFGAVAPCRSCRQVVALIATQEQLEPRPRSAPPALRAGGPSSTITPPSMNMMRSPTSRANADLVGDDHHRHALLRQLADYAQHLADQLGVERARSPRRTA